MRVNSIFFFHSDLKEVRIGVVKDFTVMLNVTNKAEDSAYYSQIILKHPADLDYIGPIQVTEDCFNVCTTISIHNTVVVD